jgi:rhodanese-related sulfurtransferase
MTGAAERISVQRAHEQIESDPDTLLVCAYDDDEKFEQNHLEGAISLDDLESRADSLPKSTEIIFYCA